MAEPRDACSLLNPPPSLHSESSFVLLTTEDGCDLFTKVFLAQEANYHSVIIVMNTKYPRVPYIQEEDKMLLEIDVSFVGAGEGKKLERFAYNQTSNARQD